MLKINLEYQKGILFIRLEGMLTRQTVYKINNYLVPTIIKQKIKYLVLNLGKLDKLDDSGIDAILNIKDAALNNHGLLCLCDVNPLLNRNMRKIKVKKLANETIALKEIEV